MTQRTPHAVFRQLDGRHPLRRLAPRAVVDYAARRLRGSRVRYLNFELAREMGLIARDHPDRLTGDLRRAVLETFSQRIVNEWDVEHGLRVPARDRRPGRYMATRYLQLQHPGRQGRTSGDGRSIWNGCLRARDVSWDVSSCGTGVTRLCPATAVEGRFFRTGSRIASYGCGTSSVEEGIGTALMSEVFWHNGFATERVLAVIELADGLAINVRAGRNLLRPSHFLAPLKQGDLETLRGIAEAHAARQIENGDWPALRSRPARWRYLAERLATDLGRVTAAFEREYVFCWLDWDGDNILMDGGIIDYGSVRQFGLYHREYRFDDVERWSTTIPEQRRKARGIVRAFAQVRDALCSGHKRPLREYRDDPLLEIFDRSFARERDRRLLHHVGFEPPDVRWLQRNAADAIARLDRVHGWFERARSSRGPCPASDGLTWNAIYSTRDLLRELPRERLERDAALPAAKLLEIAASAYASARERRITAHRARQARELQRAWLDLVDRIADARDSSRVAVLRGIAARAALIDRRDRITGDAIDYAAHEIVTRPELGAEQVHRLIAGFAASQDLQPRHADPRAIECASTGPGVRAILDAMLQVVDELRHGL